MDSLRREIILVSYQFCPMGGIGTRRWSKFAKYLSQSGYKVHVICADYKISSSMNWCHDVMDNPNIIIHRIKMHYPEILLGAKRTFFIKFFERFIKLALFYIDFGQYTKHSLESKIREIFKTSDCRLVVTTGGPYSQFYYLAKLKFKLNFRLILDYRDPWNMILRIRGPFKYLLQKRSLCMENFALRNADNLIFTNNDLKNKYITKYNFIDSKSVVIFNGYDTDDYIGIRGKKDSDSPFFNIVYLGSVTSGRAEAFSLILETIKNNPDIIDFNRIRIHVYAPNIHSIEQLDNNLKPLIAKYIIHHQILPPMEAMQKLADADACLSVNEKRFSYLIGAKTYDYLALKKPILHISDGGELSEILKAGGHFVSDYDSHNCRMELQKLIQHSTFKNINPDQNFELNHLTQNLIKVIEDV